MKKHNYFYYIDMIFRIVLTMFCAVAGIIFILKFISSGFLVAIIWILKAAGVGFVIILLICIIGFIWDDDD